MIKPLSLLMLCLLAFFAHAQNGASVKLQNASSAIPITMPYGKIDMADLEMKACDFEPDANAEILFDKGTVYIDRQLHLNFDRHIRIKIFNENGKNRGDVRLEYFAASNLQFMSNIKAETINLNNGAVQIEPVDNKLIFTKPLNKYVRVVTFAFPNVKPGSVIEYTYSLTTTLGSFPNWYFQNNMPTRYSELSTKIPNIIIYKKLEMVHYPYVKNTADVIAMANIPSISNEPFMTCRNDNAERILHHFASIHEADRTGYFYAYAPDTWKKVAESAASASDFGDQFRRKLAGEEDIINKAKSLGSDESKIAYIFNEVKNAMKWNENFESYTVDGTSEAWTKKIGNSTEINLILYHLLKKAGLNAFPMLTSTRSNGKVNPALPNVNLFNTTVAYIPVDSVNYYVLDATDKFNSYKDIPVNLLNNFGLCVDKENDKSDMVFLENINPVSEISVVNGEILPDGKMSGTAQVTSYSYNRNAVLKNYKADGEEKYIKQINDNDNNTKITSLKLENMDVDTLPLTQTYNFSQDLAGSDENYIYFKPNHFAANYVGSFLRETRFSDIDFGYITSTAFNGTYKVPPGFKVDVMPKNIVMSLPDNSITFKRIAAEQDGTIVIRYALFIKKSLFYKQDYADFHQFFKKLSELLNEQVVLKKQ